MIKKFLIAFIFVIGIFNAAYCVDDVLYWMIDENAKVHYSDGTSVYVPALIPGTYDTSLAARVRVTGENILEDTFLNLYAGEGEIWDGSMGIDFGDSGSGYWGCGVPTGNQSPITAYAAPEFSFIIELGNYMYDESSDTESWTTIASSQTRSYNSILDYVHYTFDINPPHNGIWNPTDFYAAVPEPNSGMLILIGFSLLYLRRKKIYDSRRSLR